jgi:hypothetical protein
MEVKIHMLAPLKTLKSSFFPKSQALISGFSEAAIGKRCEISGLIARAVPFSQKKLPFCEIPR